jgi:hypothetical protein
MAHQMFPFMTPSFEHMKEAASTRVRIPEPGRLNIIVRAESRLTFLAASASTYWWPQPGHRASRIALAQRISRR